MGSNRDLSVPVTDFAVTGIIDQGCEFEGKLCFQGTVRINGHFKGQIYTPDTLVIGEDALVEGEIEAGVVVVSGELKGNIKARYRVEFHSPAVFKGEVSTPSIYVESGVIFNASNRMAQSGTLPSPQA